MESIDYLIDYLLEENKEVILDNKASNFTEKFNLYRSLCNIRKPNKISDEYLKKEDELLQKVLSNKKIVDVNDIKSVNQAYSQSNLEYGDIICLWQGDITSLKVDSIVNAGNSQGLGCFVPLHNCIDNQIHTYAGIRLRLECNQIMKGLNYNLSVSESFITNAYNLPSDYVIHTVGPAIRNNVTQHDKQQLFDCYINSLQIANDNNLESISFPCISTGVFRFPNDLASRIAISAVIKYMDEHETSFKKIVFNTYSREDTDIYERIITKNQTTKENIK